MHIHQQRERIISTDVVTASRQLRDGKPFLAEPDGRVKHILERHLAASKVLDRVDKSSGCARNGHGVRAAEGDLLAIDAELARLVEGERRGAAARPIQPFERLLLLVPVEYEDVASDAAVAGLGDVERGGAVAVAQYVSDVSTSGAAPSWNMPSHSYSRVSRVSSLAQNLKPGFVGQRLRGSDDSLGCDGRDTETSEGGGRARMGEAGTWSNALPQTTLLRDAKLKRSKSGFRGASRWLHLSLSLRDVAMMPMFGRGNASICSGRRWMGCKEKRKKREMRIFSSYVLVVWSRACQSCPTRSHPVRPVPVFPHAEPLCLLGLPTPILAPALRAAAETSLGVDASDRKLTEDQI